MAFVNKKLSISEKKKISDMKIKNKDSISAKIRLYFC